MRVPGPMRSIPPAQTRTVPDPPVGRLPPNSARRPYPSTERTQRRFCLGRAFPPTVNQYPFPFGFIPKVRTFISSAWTDRPLPCRYPCATSALSFRWRASTSKPFREHQERNSGPKAFYPSTSGATCASCTICPAGASVFTSTVPPTTSPPSPEASFSLLPRP